MERMDDKIIKDKINSLDSLPENYQPSLESKWELLEAGLQEKKPDRRKRFYYVAIAACFFLFCGFSWLALKMQQFATEEKNTAILEKKHQNNSLKEIITGPEKGVAIPPNTNSEAAAPALPGTNISLPVFKKGRGGNSEQRITDNSRNVEEKPDQQILTDSKTLMDSAVHTYKNIAETKRPKKKKARFVEIDFNDVPRTNISPPAENYAENTIKFRFGTSVNNYNYQPDNANSSFLKITKTFPIKDN